MGHFGGPHHDLGDFGAGHTCCLCLSDLRKSPGCEPGRLHLLGIGVWWELEYMSQLFFSGLLRHGGTPPLVPQDVELEGWEIRVNVINYPAAAAVSGEAKRPLHSVPYEEFPCYVPAEMTGAPFVTPVAPKFPLWSNHATHGQDGWIGLPPLELLNFLARSLLHISHWNLRQPPSSLQIELDPDIFLKAFSILENGKRVTADPWPTAPNKDVREPFGQPHKEIQDEFLIKQYNRMLQTIPVLAHNKYANWDITDRPFGARPHRKLY